MSHVVNILKEMTDILEKLDEKAGIIEDRTKQFSGVYIDGEIHVIKEQIEMLEEQERLSIETPNQSIEFMLEKIERTKQFSGKHIMKIKFNKSWLAQFAIYNNVLLKKGIGLENKTMAGLPIELDDSIYSYAFIDVFDEAVN